MNNMFEIEPRKSARISNNSKNNSSSRAKLASKEQNLLNQKIVLDIVKTDTNLKQKKSKSQCLSKNSNGQRKSIDVCKFMNTTRSTGRKKSKDKIDRIAKKVQQLYTEDRIRHQSYLISNLHTQKSAQLKWIKKKSLKKTTQGRSAEKRKIAWNQKGTPYQWQAVLDNYSHFLTKYEQSQIKQYKKIYYIGHKAEKRQVIDCRSPIFDTEQKQYIFVQNDHIGYRYQMLSQIGKGSYGQVFLAYDHKNKQQIALKIIKNDQKFSKQAFIQIKILSHIKQIDEQKQSNVIKIKDFVIFRKHVCIIFELLSDNLYELIIRNNYNGLNQELIRRFAIQILVSLQFLRKNKIIHCDLKPENILLKEYNKSGIKLIDFGSSCFEKETIYTYIQSRYYRAPEITLGIPYNHYIDIWSTGCILIELFTGVPVFPGENQYEQMKYMTDTLGMPPTSLIARGNRRSVFFDQANNLKPQIKGITSGHEMFSKALKERINNEDFIDFINCFLKWIPEERTTPTEALGHYWIKKGLPSQLKNKLSMSSKQLKKQLPNQINPSQRMRTKSRQKGSSVKIITKASQQKLKKSYGLKF